MILTSLEASAVVLHRELLDQLALLCEQEKADMENILSLAVFTIDKYINRLYMLLPEEGLMDIQKEILFFKSIKPLFTAEREYYQRLYHATVFGTGNRNFWPHEITRMDKILNDHLNFVEYFHKGQVHKDHEWFIQGQVPMPTTLCTHSWETNPRHTSARDNWVAGLIAVARYKEWLKMKTESLEKQL